jgi:hypothetical protein
MRFILLLLPVFPAVPILGRVGAGFHGNPVPGDSQRCRSRLALGVLPLCQLLPLANDELRPGGSGFVYVFR